MEKAYKQEELDAKLQMDQTLKQQELDAKLQMQEKERQERLQLEEKERQERFRWKRINFRPKRRKNRNIGIWKVWERVRSKMALE